MQHCLTLCCLGYELSLYATSCHSVAFMVIRSAVVVPVLLFKQSLFCLFICLLIGSGDWTRGLVHAEQLLYQSVVTSLSPLFFSSSSSSLF